MRLTATIEADIDFTARYLVAFVLTAAAGLVAMAGVHRRPPVRHAWSYGVYCVGYRLLSVQISCGSLAVSGAPFVLKALCF